MTQRKKNPPQNPASASLPPVTPNPIRLMWIAMGVTLVTFLGALSCGFVNWDDDATILNNPNLAKIDVQHLLQIFGIKSGSAQLGNYNPLSIFSFFVEKAITGSFNAGLVHFDNILLHVLAVMMVFRVLMALGFGKNGAFVGSLFFGVHPMRVESVVWATERKDVLFGFLFFAALWYYIRWIQSGKAKSAYFTWAVVLALLSCLAKVQAVTLPLSMLLVDYWLRRPASWRETLVEKWTFWGVSLIFGLINVYTLGLQGAVNPAGAQFSLIERICIGGYTLGVYIYKVLLPYPMLPLYTYPSPLPAWIYAGPVIFVLFGLAVWQLYRQDRRVWVFGLLFFFVNVVFLLQIITAGQGFLADRFTYVPYFGIFAVAAWYYEVYLEKPAYQSSLRVSVWVLGLLYVGLSYWQTGIWKNSETLWAHVIEYAPDKSGLPYWYRGQYYRGVQQYEAAMRDYENALRMEPQNPEMLNSRGKTLFDMAMSGKYPKEQSGQFLQRALEDYNRSLDLAAPLSPVTQGMMYINRGAALGTLNRLEAAEQDFNHGLQLDPQNKMGYLNRAMLHLKLQQPEKTLEDYNRYLELDPGNKKIQSDREKLRQRLNGGMR